MKNTFKKAWEILEARKDRSAWDKGVTLYAIELLEKLEEAAENGYFLTDTLSNPASIEKAMLNGAKDWKQYSWGGCSLCYDFDIAERICNPSELKKTRNGERHPNAREEWLDTQARALSQACSRVKRAIKEAMETI